MFQILFAWIYAAIFIYLSGSVCVSLHNRIVKNDAVNGIFYVVFAGIMATTMYAQVFSIWAPVGGVANLILAVLLLVYAICDRKRIGEQAKLFVSRTADCSKKNKGIYGIIVVLMILVYAACSSGAVKLIDTDWYHAQNIRWIEDYGCVKGVANLLFPLGFNSPQHYFDALFSQKFIWNQSVRFSGGLFGVIICLHGLNRVKDFFKHREHIADAIAIGEIIYSVIITAFFADPYTDTLPNILILFIAAEWFATVEERKADVNLLSWLCVLGVFATTVKSSAAMVVLFVVYPAYLLIKNKKYRECAVYITEGILICIPYLVTNIIVTGYPIYLVSWLSWPNCNWKIDPAVLQYAVDDMVAYARMPGATINEALNCGLRWIPGWFKNESVSHQILYLGLVVMIVYDVVCTIVEIFKKKLNNGWNAYIRVCIYLGLVYWMSTIPQVKYCWSYLILPLCIVPLSHPYANKVIRRFAIACAGLVGLLFLGFYSLRTLGYTKDGIANHIAKQQDYGQFSFDEIEINGLKFYIKPEEGDIACGYYVFPQLDNIDKAETMIVGDSYRDGFTFR